MQAATDRRTQPGLQSRGGVRPGSPSSWVGAGSGHLGEEGRRGRPWGPSSSGFLVGSPPPADAPRLTELPRDIAVELSRSAFLACRATGRPPPMVTWRRRDGLPPGPRQQRDSGVLLIESKTWGAAGWCWVPLGCGTPVLMMAPSRDQARFRAPSGDTRGLHVLPGSAGCRSRCRSLGVTAPWGPQASPWRTRPPMSARLGTSSGRRRPRPGSASRDTVSRGIGAREVGGT